MKKVNVDRTFPLQYNQFSKTKHFFIAYANLFLIFFQKIWTNFGIIIPECRDVVCCSSQKVVLYFYMPESFF